MITFTHTIKATNGIHARPAGMLVSKAKQMQSNIQIECRNQRTDLKKLMSLLLLNIKQGDTIKVIVEGNNEKKEALDIEKYIKMNF